jgi:putative ABC transport system ATP-binding protein
MSASEPQPRAGPHQATGPIITVSRLNHWFGEGKTSNRVVCDLDLEVWPGQLLILTGPNGAGKTTLLTLIGGLRSIQEGTVRVQRRELKGLGPEALAEVREDIGFIFQAHNLFASLTAFQTVLMALEMKPIPREERRRRATEVLTQLGLGNHLHSKPAALSGGQKQRVAIARALANRPRLILADEPTAALDRQSSRDVVTFLQKLAREEGCTTLMVSHEPRLFDVADRIITMEAGRITSDVLVQQELTARDLLARYPDFASLTREVLSDVAAGVLEESHSAGSIIFHQGEEGIRFYMIWKGTVDIVVREAGSEKLLATLKAGDFFGQTSLLTGKKRAATARAREDVELYALDKAAFHAALEARSATGL